MIVRPERTKGRWTLASALAFLSIAIVCLTQLDQVAGRVLDPTAVSLEQPVLAAIADKLDAHGIDTVYGKSTDYPISAGGARIAPLAGFTPNKRAWGSYVGATWIAAFQKGVVGFVAAVPDKPSALSQADESCLKDIATLGADVCEFVRRWLSSPPDQRIFVAFTNDDFGPRRSGRQIS